VEYRTSKDLNNGLQRAHQYLKQRLYPMRGFKQAASADRITCGHAFIQNLRNGFSMLTAALPRQLRVVTAWSLLTKAI
ncbi:MAG: transposase, partial [Chloroflexota bacterium]|nr:transposase [Chloroflexota bacterium]